jgi:molybdenum cofactor cytidylyltransferase
MGMGMAFPFERIAGCVLAAGASRRMGEVNKLLLLQDGIPLVRRLVERYLDAGASRLLVVVGHEAELIRAALGDLPILFVDHVGYNEGMGSSVAAAMPHLSAMELEGFFVSPGDLPDLTVSAIQLLEARFRQTSLRQVVRPVHRGLPGHPVFFPAHWIDRLSVLRGEEGARRLIGPGDRVLVPIDDPGVIRDVDTPADWG